MVDIRKMITMRDGWSRSLDAGGSCPLGTESLQTHRWREMDSNSRFRAR
jgi:hypothetical protein